MATFTYAPTFHDYGDLRVSCGSCAVGTLLSGSIDTGLSVVYGLSITPLSATTTTVPVIKANIGSDSSTTSNGMINMRPTISGDTYYVVAYGV